MRVWPWIWVLGCTDYDFKSVQENELGEDTAEVSTSSEGDDDPTSSEEQIRIKIPTMKIIRQMKNVPSRM